MDLLKQVNLARRTLGLPLFPPRPVTAAGVDDPGDNYREWQHPRDSEGRWIKKGGIVKIGEKIAGIVKGMNPDYTIDVEVTDSDDDTQVGTIVKAKKEDITVVDSKATLPDQAPVAEMDEDPPINHHAYNASRRTFRPMTDEERKKFKPNPGWSNVQINEHWDQMNPDVPDSIYDGLIYTGYDKQGKKQGSYDKRHEARRDREKFEPGGAVDQTLEALPTIEKAIRRDMHDNDSAAALGLQLFMGMRVGGTNARNKKTNETAYGASSLLAEHVTLNDDGSVTFSFKGKKQVSIKISTQEPVIRELMERKLQERSGSEKLFDTNDDKVRKYFDGMQKEFGLPKLKTHNLRHAYATAMAINIIQSMPKPKNEAERKAFRRKVGELVAAALGNNWDQALESYINPHVFDVWAL